MMRKAIATAALLLLAACGHPADNNASETKNILRASLTISPFAVNVGVDDAGFIAAELPVASLLLQCGEGSFGGASLNQVHSELALKVTKNNDGTLRIVNNARVHIEAKTLSILSYCDANLSLKYPAGVSANGVAREALAVVVPGVGIDKVINFGYATSQIIKTLDGGNLKIHAVPYPATTSETCSRKATFTKKDGTTFGWGAFTTDSTPGSCA